MNHYNRSLDTLAECGKIHAFNDFLKVRYSRFYCVGFSNVLLLQIKALKCGHNLRDLLIVPVQRIPVCRRTEEGRGKGSS